FRTSITTLRRKLFSDDSPPALAWKNQTRFAHSSNSRSSVIPRSSVIASNSVLPGDLRVLLGSFPSRCLTTSVVFFSPLTLLIPATGVVLPSQKTRNLKFLYGSRRWDVTAIALLLLLMSGSGQPSV